MKHGMYTAVVRLAFGSGGALPNPHRYWSGKGTAMSRSPKKAIRLAERRAMQACGDGAAYIPILEVVTLNGVEV